MASLPPRKIAERLGIPSSTVRMRLHRGLKRMRATLEKEYGDKRSMCLGLALLSGSRGRFEVAAGQATAQLLLAWLVPLLLLAAALDLGWHYLSPASGPGEPVALLQPDPAETAPVARAEAIVDTDEQPERSSIPSVEAVPELAESAQRAALPTIYGTVVDENGAIVAGATVVCDARGKEIRWAAASDANGNFTIKLDDADLAYLESSRLPAVLGARARGHGPSAIAAWSLADPHHVILELRGGGAAYSLRVIDRAGEPVAAAQVSIGQAFRLGRGHMGAHVRLNSRNVGRLKPGSVLRTDVHESFGSFVSGRGHMGAQVLLDGGTIGRLPPVETFETNEEGWARAYGLEPGRHPVEVRAPGYAPRVVEIEVSEQSHLEQTLTLAAGARLRGRLERVDGLPLGRAVVYAFGAAPWNRESVMIEPDGSFELDDLPAGEVTVFAESRTPDTVSQSARATLTLRAGQVTTWSPALSAEVVRGRLVNEAGEPLAGWIMQVRLDQNLARRIAQKHTNTDGSFTFTAYPPFAATLMIFHPESRFELPNHTVKLDPTQDGEIVIRLSAERERVGGLRGKLLDPRGRPAEYKTTILAYLEGTQQSRACRTEGSAGRFGLEPLPAGKYRLVFPDHGLGYIAESTLDLTAGGMVDLGTLKLPEVGRLKIGAGPGVTPGMLARLRLTRVCAAPSEFELVMFNGRTRLPQELTLGPGTYRVDVFGSEQGPELLHVPEGGSVTHAVSFRR